MSPADATSIPDLPGWMPWAAAATVTAFLAVAAVLVLRVRRGLPMVAPRPHPEVPWGGADVLVTLLGGLASAAVVGDFLGPKPPLDLQLAGNAMAMSAASTLAVGWLAVRGATAADLGFVAGRWQDDLRLAVAGLALVLAPLLGLASLLDSLVPYEHPVVELLGDRRDPWAVGVVLASALLAAPLAEELFFRRILQGWLERRLPEADGAFAIAISAAAFALAHPGQGLAFVPLFPLGLVLGFLARRTGSIVPCILLHAMFNAVSVAMLLAAPPPAR